MKRNEAVTFLRELFSQCNDMALYAISLEEQKTNGSKDYRLHIRGVIHETDKQITRDVAIKYSLQVTDNGDGVIIYNPIRTA